MRPVLLVIDMQNDFISPDGILRVEQGIDIIENSRKALEICRERAIPVFYAVRRYSKDGSDVENFRKDIFLQSPACIEGTWGAEIIEELKPREGDRIVVKRRFSAFFQTELELLLKVLTIDTIIVIGVQTPNCIRSTVFDAVAMGYNIIIVNDAIAADTQETHDSNVKDMVAIGARLSTSDRLNEIIKDEKDVIIGDG